MNDKAQQALALTREIFATLTPPANTRDFEFQVRIAAHTTKPFSVNCYVGKSYTFECGYGDTPEEAVSDLAAKLPPHVTPESLRSKALAIMAEADALEKGTT